MKVLWVTQVYPRFAGDMFGGFLHRLAATLVQRGVEVRVVAPWDRETEPGGLDGVHVETFRYPRDEARPLAYSGEMHRRVLADPFAWFGFLRATRNRFDDVRRRMTPDVVHAHWWIPTGVAIRRRIPAGLPFVVSLHGTDVRLLKKFPLLRGSARAVFRRADRVLPVSSSLAEDVRGLVASDRLEVLPMPADGVVFTPGEPRIEAEPRFVLVARLTAQKRVGDALRALARVRAAEPAVHLEIIGDGPERGALERLSNDLGLNAEVTFHGRMDPQQIAIRLRGATAVLLPSESEGYGLTLVEGGLCGVAGIGAASGGIPDTLIDGENGLLVPPRDSGALADAMLRLVRDPALTRRLGDRALELALQRTSAPLADRLLRAYEGLSGGL